MAIGCDEEKTYSLRFSHKNHVEEYDVACDDCHGKMKEGRFAKPGHSTCADCHDDWMNPKDVSEKTCGECHQSRNLSELEKLEPPEPVQSAGGSFVHTAALTNRCADCHNNLMGEDQFTTPELKRGEVARIRNEAHRWKMDCAACHENLAPDAPPADHDQNWARRHGQKGQQPDNTCAMCHTEQSCRECHQETMPESHNNLWRLKTHGTVAAWDRARCQVCHEEDSCTACHQEIRPQSHNANWKKTHCQQCHSSAGAGTGCAFCHEGGIDSHPDPHPAGWNQGHCRSCHNGTQESEQCAVCHGPMALGDHPNPHGAGWNKNHCTQCHNGSVNGVSCKACHGGNLLEDHPNPHNAGWKTAHCTQCHNGSVNGVSCKACHGGNLLEDHPNPHPPSYVNTHCNNCHAGSTVNGVSCATCHGGDMLDNHPNPHSGGFRRSHCFSCHEGSQSQNDCGICHEGAGSVALHEDFWPPVHDRFGPSANCYDCHN